VIAPAFRNRTEECDEHPIHHAIGPGHNTFSSALAMDDSLGF
tara:strand:- start:79 stop:204 length:126 start_codon:yes stop_codon:yes gene_type:complete